MKLELDSIYTIKISNGDELVAKITGEDDATYTVTRPLTVVPGREGIQMIFSLFTANPDKNVSINKTAVAMICQTREEVGDHYLEATTGLKPVRKPSIIMG